MAKDQVCLLVIWLSVLTARHTFQAFLSSEPCQHAIWKTWTRGYEASGWAIAVSAFTIFPVLALIHFEDEGGQMAPSDIRGSVVSITKAVPSAPRRSANVSLVPEIVDGAVTSKQLEEEAHNQNSNGKRFWFNGSQESLNFLAPFHVGITAGSKYITFYRSPSVKYACHTVMIRLDSTIDRRVVYVSSVSAILHTVPDVVRLRYLVLVSSSSDHARNGTAFVDVHSFLRASSTGEWTCAERVQAILYPNRYPHLLLGRQLHERDIQRQSGRLVDPQLHGGMESLGFPDAIHLFGGSCSAHSFNDIQVGSASLLFQLHHLPISLIQDLFREQLFGSKSGHAEAHGKCSFFFRDRSSYVSSIAGVRPGHVPPRLGHYPTVVHGRLARFTLSVQGILYRNLLESALSRRLGAVRRSSAGNGKK